MSIHELSDNVLTWREDLKETIKQLHEKPRYASLLDKQDIGVKEALAIAKLRIHRDELVFQCREVFFYMESKPHEFSEAVLKAKNDIKRLIEYIDKWTYGHVFERSTKTLKAYIEMRKEFDIPMPDEPPLTTTKAVMIPKEIQDILEENDSYQKEHTRLRWKMAIRKVMEKNRYDHERTKIKGKIYTHSVMGEMQDIDRDILASLRKTVEDEHRYLSNRHQGVLDWVKLVEEVYQKTESDLKKTFHDLQIEDERLERILTGVAKGLLAIAVSPWFLDKFADPALQAFQGLCNLAQDHINVGSGDSDTKYRLGAFFSGLSSMNKNKLPDTMTAKMKAVQQEAFIDHIQKIKEYLQYKIGPHSVAGDLSRLAIQNDQLSKIFLTSSDQFNELITSSDDMQRKPINTDEERRIMKEAEDIKILLDDSTALWTDGHETLQVIAVVKAMKMLALREKQHHTPDDIWFLSDGDKTQLDERLKILYKQIENSVADDLKAAVTEAYKVVRTQYAQPREIERLIQKISFDDSQSGRQAVNRANRMRLVDKMALALKIKLLVSYAVQYEQFWGSESYAKHDRKTAFKPDSKDTRFGLYAATGTPRRITKLILTLIEQSDNDDLKTRIRLIKEKNSKKGADPERVAVPVKDNRLLKGRYSRKAREGVRIRAKKVAPCCTPDFSPSDEQLERQEMLNEIIEVYLEGNVDDLLKDAFYGFAKEEKIELSRKTYEASEHPDKSEKWLSEDQLRERVNGILRPFAEVGVRHNEILKEQASVTKSLLVSRPLVNEADKLYQEELETSEARRVRFK